MPTYGGGMEIYMNILKQFKELNKFEIHLYITSVLMVSLSFFIFQSKDFLTLVASLTGVTALIFVSKGCALGQLITIIFAVFYGIISYFFTYYGEMITYLCMTAPTALAALISWIKNPYKDTSEVKVAKLNKKNILIMILLAFIVTVTFYFILKKMGNANLPVSTLSVTTSFCASYLTVVRSPYYAVLYALNDIVLIVLWSLASVENISYVPMVTCFVMFLFNDLYGFFNWQRMKKTQI